MTTGLRRLLGSGLGMAMLAIPGLSIGGDDKSDVYAKDVAFMVVELPKKAGHFFGSKPIDRQAVSEGFTRELANVHGDEERAGMISDSPLSGCSSSKDRLEVPSCMFKVFYSVASNKGRFNGGKGIDGIGVPPNEVTPHDPQDLLKRVDTQIRRAEEILSAGLPTDKVAYQPKKSLYFD